MHGGRAVPRARAGSLHRALVSALHLAPRKGAIIRSEEYGGSTGPMAEGAAALPPRRMFREIDRSCGGVGDRKCAPLHRQGFEETLVAFGLRAGGGCAAQGGQVLRLRMPAVAHTTSVSRSGAVPAHGMTPRREAAPGRAMSTPTSTTRPGRAATRPADKIPATRRPAAASRRARRPHRPPLRSEARNDHVRHACEPAGHRHRHLDGTGTEIARRLASRGYRTRQSRALRACPRLRTPTPAAAMS